MRARTGAVWIFGLLSVPLAVGAALEHSKPDPIDAVRPDALQCLTRYSNVVLTRAESDGGQHLWLVHFAGVGRELTGGGPGLYRPAFGQGVGQVSVDTTSHSCAFLYFDVLG